MLDIDVKKRRTYDATGKEPNEGVIDHIYLKGKDIKIVDGGIIELGKALSDHCPVWAGFMVESGKNRTCTVDKDKTSLNK
jgi:endonuclease/exonuclease/phosphatase (EEP) superfamily protein YafD